jgi:hypothetical protein
MRNRLLGRLSIQDYVRKREASILLVARTPGHVVQSMLRRDGWTLEEAISRWAQGIQEMHRAYDAFKERTHLVLFESLVKSPEEVMRDVSKFLDVSYDPSMLEGYKNTPQYERKGALTQVLRVDPQNTVAFSSGPRRPLNSTRRYASSHRRGPCIVSLRGPFLGAEPLSVEDRCDRLTAN